MRLFSLAGLCALAVLVLGAASSDASNVRRGFPLSGVGRHHGHHDVNLSLRLLRLARPSLAVHYQNVLAVPAPVLAAPVVAPAACPAPVPVTDAETELRLLRARLAADAAASCHAADPLSLGAGSYYGSSYASGLGTLRTFSTLRTPSYSELLLLQNRRPHLGLGLGGGRFFGRPVVGGGGITVINNRPLLSLDFRRRR